MNSVWIKLGVSSRLAKALCLIILIIPNICLAALGPGQVSASVGQSIESTDGQVQIVDQTGQPLPGVTLSTQPRPDTFAPENITETSATISDAQGKLAPPPDEVADTYFILRKPGFEVLAFHGNRPLPLKITMPKGKAITGKVLDSAGQPISGALVGPVRRAGNPERVDTRKLLPRMVVRSAGDGSFTLDNLPPDNLAIQVVAPGHTPRSVTVPAGETDIKIALGTGGAIITGKVIGSKDKAPQAAVPVEAIGEGLVLFSYSDAQGTYAFDNIPTGTWTLRPGGGGPMSGTQSRTEVADIGKIDAVIDIPLVLNQGIILAGRAIDAQTSQPLAGINITLAGYAGRGAKAVLTQQDGTFSFENLDSLQDVIFRFDPVKFVYLLPGGAYRDYFDISTAGDTNFDLTTITLPLHKRLAVRGSVTNAANEKLPDVEVRLQSLDVITSTPSKSGPTPLEFFSYTNANGEFVTGLYPPGRYKVWAQQEALVSQIQKIDVFSTSPVAPLKFKLDQAAQLSGLVTDSNDKPVTNAVVIAWPQDLQEPTEEPIPGRESYVFTRTDSTGRFTLSGLRGEPIIVRATDSAYVQPVSLAVDPAAVQNSTTDSVTLKFPAGGEFEAYVTDSANVPLSQAWVRLEYKDGLDGKAVSVVTDQYGRAFVGSLPTSRLDKVMVSHPVYAPYESDKPVSLPVKNMKIALQQRGSLVADVSGEPPIAGAPVEVFLLSASANSTNPAVKPPEQGFEKISQTNVVAGKALFASLQPGWYKAAFADGGTYSESDTVYVDAGSGDLHVKLELPKGNHVTGIVKDKSTGKGIAGANITLHPASDSTFVTERALQNTTTGEGGAFEFYNVSTGLLHAKVIAAGYPDLEKDLTAKAGEVLELELNNEPAALSGKITASGSPVEGALLVLAHAQSNPVPVASVTSSADGSYALHGFPAGKYTLSVEAPIGEGDNISRKSVDIDIADENATQNVDFQALVQVTGTARLDGKPIARDSGQPVTLMFQPTQAGNETKMVRLSDGGKFSTQMEPGSYMVSLEDREGTPVDIPAGESKTLDLNF